MDGEASSAPHNHPTEEACLHLTSQKTGLGDKKHLNPPGGTHLWMMDLSYSSPAGVCMMANSSRVTRQNAGFCTEAVMVLMRCGRTRSGDRMEREPMAFMEDCQRNQTQVRAWAGTEIPQHA